MFGFFNYLWSFGVPNYLPYVAELLPSPPWRSYYSEVSEKNLKLRWEFEIEFAKISSVWCGKAHSFLVDIWLSFSLINKS